MNKYIKQQAKHVVFVLLCIVILNIQYASAAYISSPDNNLKNIFKADSIDNISVIQAPDGSGGYLIYSTGTHASPITVTIPKSKLRKINPSEWVIHKDEYGKSKLQYIITIDKGSAVEFTIELSSTCIGCYTGTYSVIGTGLSNASVLNLGQSFDLSGVSNITITNISSVGTRNLSTQRLGVNTSGLVLAMNFDTNGSCVDSSGMGNNGTSYGNMTCGNVTGKYNNGSYFDGVDDYVTVGNGVILKPPLYITTSIWVKHTVFNDASAAFSMSRNGGSMMFYPSGTEINFYINVDGWKSNSVTKASTPVGFWYNFVNVYDGVTFKTYQNGVQIATQNLTGNISYDTANIVIGGYTQVDNAPSTTDYFTGSIDDVRIYNRALSAEEIYQNYLARADYFQAKTNSNSTYSDSWNGSGNISIPYDSMDSDFSSISLLFPRNMTIDGVTVYDYWNNSAANLTVVTAYTENTTTFSQTCNYTWCTTTLTVLHANSEIGYLTIPMPDIARTLYPNGATSLTTNNGYAVLLKNTTYYFINEGSVDNSTTYSYVIHHRLFPSPLCTSNLNILLGLITTMFALLLIITVFKYLYLTATNPIDLSIRILLVIIIGLSISLPVISDIIGSTCIRS